MMITIGLTGRFGMTEAFTGLRAERVALLK
jgi:hypothetical protein